MHMIIQAFSKLKEICTEIIIVLKNIPAKWLKQLPDLASDPVAE